MKLLHIFCLYCLSLGLLCSVSAKPLTTEKIIFTSSRDGNWEIYMMNPDGSQQVRLTNHRSRDSYPVLSPTGRRSSLFLTEVGSRISISCELMEGVNDPCFERTPHTETTRLVS